MLNPVSDLILVVLDLYTWVVIISAIMSWLVAFNVVNTSNRLVYTIGEFLYRLTEPALRPRLADGILLTVRLTPRAASQRIGGIALDAAGAAALKVWVTAAPTDGRANQALIELLAKHWRLPKSSISLQRGAAERTKTLRIAGDAEALERRILEACK